MEKIDDEKILRQRALRLAAPIEATSVRSAERLVLCFELGRAKFGIEAQQIHEVFPLDHAVRVPCTPAHIVGIAVMRGEIVSLVNLKQFLGISSQALTNFNKVIVVRHEGKCVGLVADKLLGVETVDLSLVHTDWPAMPAVQTEFLSGMTNEPLFLLDVARLLANERFIVNDEPAQR